MKGVTAAKLFKQNIVITDDSRSRVSGENPNLAKDLDLKVFLNYYKNQSVALSLFNKWIKLV